MTLKQSWQLKQDAKKFDGRAFTELHKIGEEFYKAKEIEVVDEEVVTVEETQTGSNWISNVKLVRWFINKTEPYVLNTVWSYRRNGELKHHTLKDIVTPHEAWEIIWQLNNGVQGASM